jgi:Holliday junction resolvase
LIDFKKVNRLRRSRGYSFEYNLVNAFNTADGWAARRLGGSSSGLPDVVVTNKNKSILYSIECKSGESDILVIPRDQIDRCVDIVDNFLTAYENRYVVFAFKFKGTKKRKLQYRFLFMNSWGGLPKHLKGLSYNIRTDEIRCSTFYDDYPICLPIFGHLGPRSIPEFVNFL